MPSAPARADPLGQQARRLARPAAGVQAAGVRLQADLAENPRGRGFPVPRLGPQPLVFLWRVPQRVGVWPPSDLGGGAHPLSSFCPVTSAPPLTRTGGRKRHAPSVVIDTVVSLRPLRFGPQAGGGTGLAGRCRAADGSRSYRRAGCIVVSGRSRSRNDRLLPACPARQMGVSHLADAAAVSLPTLHPGGLFPALLVLLDPLELGL